MELPRRKIIRLKYYDYSSNGLYFITICDIICALKSITTKKSNILDNVIGRKIWQFRYHDHIIRSEQEYKKILEYIDTNPQKWADDCYHNI